jgi:hypothetical protein
MKISSGLSDGQVLQRLGSTGATVPLTGNCAGDGPIHATLFQGKLPLKGWKRRSVGRAVKSGFQVKLAGIPAGGPYRLRLEAGAERLEIASFFVGDVWILAGQSNMEGVGNRVGAAKPHPLIRTFSMRREWRLATEPLHVLAESPDLCHAPVQITPEAGEEMRRKAVKGTGVGLFFAREMVERSGGVPQGLICTAHGGTSMQQWSPDRKHLAGESLYASMLTSVRATGQPVAGFLWYQGESDANPADAAEYTRRMKKLVAASRRDLHQPRLPWVIVQLGRHFTDPTDPRSWNNIQEQQRLLPEKIESLETVPAIDLPLDDGIHIGAEGFPRLATRLASAADRLVYGNRHETRGPQLRKKNPFTLRTPNTLEIAFDFVRGGLQASGEPVGFRFVADQVTPQDISYKTELKGDVVTLHLNKPLIGALGLFYGHGLAPSCNITDARGFSLPVFGPLIVQKGIPLALLPFLTQWNTTEIIPATKKLNRISLSEVKVLGTSLKTFGPQGFINEHAVWTGKTGLAFFHSRLELSEPMKLIFLMGYDGPFRLWLDEKPFFTNMQGTNPCLPDESTKIASLAPGLHDICIGMDLNEGLAWGFFLRLARKDVTKEQALTGGFAKPAFFP